MSALPSLVQERALVLGSAATRIPPTVLAYLCSSFLGSAESVAVLQCCRAWCLRGADRQLLQHMLAEASLHASDVADGADTQTVDGAFYRTPCGRTPSIELPWRQRHMERVQHVLVQLEQEGVSEPRILPSFATLPSPSVAPAAFTIVDLPFELHWSTRRMRPELVVLMRIQALPPNVPSCFSPTEPKLSALWCMLGRALPSTTTPLSVTFVDDHDRNCEGLKPSPISTIALSARWMPNPEPSDASSSSSSMPLLCSQPASISLVLHSLVFHTCRYDFVAASIESLRIATASATPLNRRIRRPALSVDFQQWFSCFRPRQPLYGLLSPLNVLHYHSTDASHPAGLPSVVASLLADAPKTPLEDFTIGHIHTAYFDVAHEVDVEQVLRPLGTRFKRTIGEVYLIGVQLSRLNLQLFDTVRTVVLRAPGKSDLEAVHLDFSIAFSVLAQSVRFARRIELIDYRFGSPSTLKAWCLHASDIRLERCVFDDDDGLIDLEAHAKSMWPALHVHGGVLRAGPRFLITRGAPPGCFPVLFDPYFRNMAMAFMMAPFVGLCMLPLLGVDVVLMYLPFAGFTRLANLASVLMVYAGLAYTFFSLLVAEWNQFESIPQEFHAPPTATMFVQSDVGLFLGCTLWFNALLALPWHRAGIDPISAVAGVSVLKMMFNSLSGSNTATWIRVQRSKINLRAFVSYFVRMTILRTVQLRWFVAAYAGVGWISSIWTKWRNYRPAQPFSAIAGHSLAHRLFVDSAVSVRGIQYAPPSHLAPTLWTDARALVRDVLRGVDVMGWLRSWTSSAAWIQWVRGWIIHLRSVLHAMPYILAAAVILFVVQQLVRKARRRITPNALLIVTVPLSVVSVLLRW